MVSDLVWNDFGVVFIYFISLTIKILPKTIRGMDWFGWGMNEI